jgi:hypothetical protein
VEHQALKAAEVSKALVVYLDRKENKDPQQHMDRKETKGSQDLLVLQDLPVHQV